jgi:hypothetical protein
VSSPPSKQTRSLPDRISLRVRAGRDPFSGAWVVITLDNVRKNSFHLYFGPADDEGRLEVTREDLLEEPIKDVHLFPMDYAHPEGDWGGRIIVKPLGRGDVSRALDAHGEWSQAGVEYEAGYVEGLHELDERLRARAGVVLTADVEIDPPVSADVITREELV